MENKKEACKQTTMEELLEFIQPITKYTIEELKDLMKTNCPQSIAIRRMHSMIIASERDRAEFEKQQEAKDGK